MAECCDDFHGVGQLVFGKQDRFFDLVGVEGNGFGVGYSLLHVDHIQGLGEGEQVIVEV